MFNLDYYRIMIFAAQVALLHDTIEDTATTYDEIKEIFSEKIADAVLALSKDSNLPKGGLGSKTCR